MRVFDFDNTLYDGESIFDVFMYFLKKDFKTIIRFAPKFIRDFIRYKFDKITVEEAMESYGKAFKEYCQNYDNIYDEFHSFSALLSLILIYRNKKSPQKSAVISY